MKTKIRLRNNQKIHQPMAQKDWEFGYVDGYCRAADDRCYAIVVTEHGEFEFVNLYQIEALNDQVN